MKDARESLAPIDLKAALSMVADYARTSGLTPQQVTDLFSVGIVAARVLRPDIPAPAAMVESSEGQG